MQTHLEGPQSAIRRDTPEGPDRRYRVSFVTNFCPHYRVKTFELLAHYHDIDFFFFSRGGEWYWMQKHGTRRGDFRHEYLDGFQLFGTRVTPGLITRLWKGNYDVYVKCINGMFALPASYLVARARRKPFVLWTGVWADLQSPLHRFLAPLERYLYRHADAIVVYGEHVKRYLVSRGARPDHVFVAAHAVDNELYARAVPESQIAALRQRWQLSPSQKVVLYVGRLEPSKGLEFLFAAFARIASDDLVLLLVGEGHERDRHEQYAAEHGFLSSVRFAGYVPVEEMAPVYALASVLVLPSITTPDGSEPWGLVVNEAMNQGVPVIATPAVGAAAGGLLVDGFNGLVVPEKSGPALAEAVASIVDDSVLRDQLGRNAHETISSWNNERMVRGFREAISFAVGPSCPSLS